VTLRIKALGHATPHGSDDPAITFDAIDDRKECAFAVIGRTLMLQQEVRLALNRGLQFMDQP